MKNKKILIFFFLLVNVFIFQQDKIKISVLIDKGIDHLYNYHIDQSKHSLELAYNLDNLHPLPPFLLVVTDWLYEQTENGYETSYKTILNGTENLIPIYKKNIESFPKNPEYILYLGSTYGLKARISLAKKNGLKYYILVIKDPN